MSNRNSWLSLEFDNQARGLLHQCALQFGQYNVGVMDFAGLHMTSVFLGKGLQGKQVQALQQLNAELQSAANALPDVTLAFDRYEYFPLDAAPKKRKLLVAIFKRNMALQKWNAKVHHYLRRHGFCSYDEDEWLPHITLGRICGSNVPERDELQAFPKPPALSLTGLSTCGTQNKHISKAFHRQ